MSTVLDINYVIKIFLNVVSLMDELGMTPVFYYGKLLSNYNLYTILEHCKYRDLNDVHYILYYTVFMTI